MSNVDSSPPAVTPHDPETRRPPWTPSLQLRFSVNHDSVEDDVVVVADLNDTVGDLLKRAEQDLGVRPGGELLCQRRGRRLAVGQRLGEAGVRWGDVLKLVPPSGSLTQVGAEPRCELTIIGGPNAGATWLLGDGRYQLGRDESADIRLSDPSLSRRHARLEVGPAAITITDTESSNGVAVDGRQLPVGQPRQLLAGEAVEIGRSLIRVRPLEAVDSTGLRERNGLVEFNRQPRVKPVREWFHRRLAAPPAKHGKVRLPLLASLLPLVAGVGMFIFTKSPFMLAFAAMSPVMAIGTYVSDKRSGAKGFRGGTAEFKAKLAETLVLLDAALSTEAEERRADAPDLESLIRRARNLDPELWERRAGNADFLSLRVGVGDLPAFAAVELEDGGEPGLRQSALDALAERHTVVGVPVQMDLRRYGTVGLAGPRRFVSSETTAMVLQAACLHSPADLVILSALAESEAPHWTWLKWLPHVAPDRLGLDRGVAVGEAQAATMLAELRDLVSDRSQLGEGFTRPVNVLLVLDEDACTNRSLLTSVLTGGPAAGVYTLWMGHEARNLPGQAGATIETERERFVATVTDVEKAQSVSDVSMDGADPSVAAQTARALAPVRDISESAHSGDIPTRAGLLDLLGLSPASPARLTELWQSWDGKLSATIGVTADGPLEIDLRAEGPHALIAGTTGSGKSELLRTLVASAAAKAPPDRLNFLLIDYKGGAAFAPCKALPHVVDVVSDLDEHLAERALDSLRAELKRRERILAEHGARDLLELQHRMPELAPPMLVIAVDEFAKLREEVPEFVDGVVDIAQRGRSLGVHMVLAAQSLRNAFTNGIRANTNLRIALRVAEDTESDDVVGSSIAARIPSGDRFRGRAFARTGHGELREFQSAYVSGRTASDETQQLTITRLGVDGPVSTKPSASSGVDTDKDSDLAALGAAAQLAQQALGMAAQAAPWLPPLPELLELGSQPADAGGGRAVFGLVDHPKLQTQDPLILDLPKTGHLAVFGAGGSGKSTLLVAVAKALSDCHSPEQLRLFAIDAGSGALDVIDRLPQCGGVVRVDDAERVDRLLRELVRRAEAAPAGPAEARTVLLLDDLGVFQAEHDTPGSDSPFQNLQRVLAAGRGSGVHVVLTAARRGALTSTLSANIGARLVLRMATEEDMLTMGLDSKSVKGAKLPPGRGFTQESQEFQVAVPAELLEQIASPELTEAEMLKRGVTRITTLPHRVSRSRVGEIGTLARLPIALADRDLAPAYADLSEGHFMVAGPYRSGRSTALATLAAGLAAAGEVDLYLLSPRRSPLREFTFWKAKAIGADDCAQAADGLLQRLSADGELPRPAVVFVDDAGELGDPTISSRLERVVKLGRDRGLTVVAAAETSAARGIAVPWIRELRKDGAGLLLEPDLLGDGDLLAVKLPRRVAVPMVPGRGFLVARGRAELVQVAA